VMIRGLSVPTGDTEVRVRSSVRGRKGDPYQVILSRVE